MVVVLTGTFVEVKVAAVMVGMERMRVMVVMVIQTLAVVETAV